MGRRAGACPKVADSIALFGRPGAPSDWEEFEDDESGRVRPAQRSARASPLAFPSPPALQEPPAPRNPAPPARPSQEPTHPPTRLPTRPLLSPHAPQKYWYNESTGDTTWEQPIELAAGRAGMPDRDSLVTCAAASPPALPPLPALGLSNILPPEWEQHVDDTSGESYWHNTATGETTWEKPER